MNVWQRMSRLNWDAIMVAVEALKVEKDSKSCNARSVDRRLHLSTRSFSLASTMRTCLPGS